MELTLFDEICTEERLRGVVRGIVEGVPRRSPLDVAALRPPHLRVVMAVRHRERISAFFVRRPSGNEIVVAPGLWAFLHYYTRVAATYFLPSSPGGQRPSEHWPAARAAMAACLEWLSSPIATPRYLDFPASDHQARVGRIFGDYAFRFAICHEMAHAIGGEAPPAASEEEAIMAWSQDQEYSADGLGLALQLESLPDPTQLTNGIASSGYMLRATELLTLRLMLLAHLVDYTTWTASLSHPPWHARYFQLVRSAGGFAGQAAAEGLMSLSDQLAGFNNEIIGEASRRQDELMAEVPGLLDAAATPSDRGARDRVLELFETNPATVLAALDARRTTTVAEDVLEHIPKECRDFIGLSKPERTMAILRIPTHPADLP